MKYLLLSLLLISPLATSGEIYKCKQTNGAIGFSDKPCPADTTEERIGLKEQEIDWLDRLRSEKSSYIEITEILQKDGDITIMLGFTIKSGLNIFIRTANRLSEIPVVLMTQVSEFISSI